jgi:hypothetical protein
MRHLFDDEALAEKAAKITKALLEAQSPRLTDISEKMLGKSESRYKEIQRFLQKTDLKRTLMRLYQEEAEFVIGDPTEMKRYKAPKTSYVGTLKDGITAGYWLLVLSTPFRGRSLPCWFVVYSSRTIGDQSTSRNQEHYRCFNEVKELLGDRPLVLDREFSYQELMEVLTIEHIQFVIRLNLGDQHKQPRLIDADGKPIKLFIQPGETVAHPNVYYLGTVKVNVIGYWQKSLAKPLWVITSLEPKRGLEIYLKRMKIEIVFTQMTKMGVFASRTGRDHISDLNCFTLDNDPVNEQFYQFPFLFKVSIRQPDLDTVAEILDRSCQAGEFVLSIYLMDKLLFQVFHALTLAIQIGSSALVLRQRDDAVQVSFGESIQLGLKSDLTTPQIFTTGLQLLREPVAPLRSLQSNCDDFRMLQDLTQIVPDQLIQLVGWDVSSKTTLVEMGVNHIRLSPTYIVCIARMQLARCATEVASTAAHQTPQQVSMGSVIAAGNLLVVGQLGLDLLKLLQLNNGWNICNRDPIFRWDWSMASVWPAHWMGGRTAQARLDHAGTSYINSTGIRGISQDTSCGCCVPVFATLGCRDTHFIQMLDQSVEGSVFLQIKCKHLTHDRRFRFVDRNFGRISGVIWIDLKPINRFSPRQQNPGPVFSLTPATHPVSNQGTFVFRNRTSDLQNQLVMGILADRTIQKLDLTTIFLPFFHQQHLVNIVPSQTIRLGHHKAIDLSGCDSVSQTVQTRPVEARTTATIISKDVLPWQIPPLLADIAHQPFQLLFDRLGLGLAQGRDPCINRYSHIAPPDSFSSVSLRQSELSPALRDRLGPIGSGRLEIPVLPDGFSTGVSWLPPHSDSSDAEYTFCSVSEVRNRNGRRQWFSCN